MPICIYVYYILRLPSMIFLLCYYIFTILGEFSKIELGLFSKIELDEFRMTEYIYIIYPQLIIHYSIYYILFIYTPLLLGLY